MRCDRLCGRKIGARSTTTPGGMDFFRGRLGCRDISAFQNGVSAAANSTWTRPEAQRAGFGRSLHTMSWKLGSLAGDSWPLTRLAKS